MDYKVVLTEPARDDLRQIVAFIGQTILTQRSVATALEELRFFKAKLDHESRSRFNPRPAQMRIEHAPSLCLRLIPEQLPLTLKAFYDRMNGGFLKL